MIIGLANKPNPAIHLTGQRAKEAAGNDSQAPADKSQVPSSQTTLTGLAERLSSMQEKVQAHESFLSDYEHVPNQVLVRLRTDVSGLSNFAEEYGGKILHHFDLTGLKPSTASSEQLLLLDLNENLNVAEAMVLMGDDSRVSVVESNDIVRTQVQPSEEDEEPDLPNDLEDPLWGLYNHGQDGGLAGVDIGVQEAWKTTAGSRTGPIVAVIDSGVDYNHQDLKDNIFENKGEIPNDGIDNDGNGVVDDIHGYNAAADNTDPKDDNGHGTHVAGTIGAVGNNGKGVTGVNQEAQILPVRFLSEEGSGTTADAIKALVYANRTGSRVINNSWGGNKFNQLVFDVLADTTALVVCAAGNEAFDNDLRPVYPASYELDNVMSVTAHDRKNEFPRFANRGEKTVDLAAPGEDIYSTQPKNKYQLLSGTSMAAPHVAGAAALIATARPDVSNDDLRFLLMNNLETLPEEYGSRIISGGRLDVGKALEQDSVAPGAVGEAKVDSVTSESIKVSWKATGDDGAEGRASAYDVRYTTGQFKKGQNQSGIPFEDGDKLDVPPPKTANELETFEFPVAPSGKARHFSLGVVAVDNVLNRGELVTLDVNVPAAKVALEDNADSAQGSIFEQDEHWKRVEMDGRGKVFTDSPDGDYPANREAILVSKPFSMEDFRKPVLHFDAKFDVEQKHDEFTVEVETDGWFGKKWKEVARFDGLSDWQTHKLDISRYTGEDDTRIRFRMESDRDRNRDGVYLDNIVIAESPE